MSERLPTMTIVREGQPVLINVADYDPQRDVLPGHDAPVAPPTDVEIPDNWQELPWSEMRSLASELSQEPIKSKDDAIKAIGTAVALRQQAENVE